MEDCRGDRKETAPKEGHGANREEIAGDPEQLPNREEKSQKERSGLEAKEQQLLSIAESRKQWNNTGQSTGSPTGHTRLYDAQAREVNYHVQGRQPRLFFAPCGRVTAGFVEPRVRFFDGKGSVGCGEPDMWAGVPWGRALSANWAQAVPLCLFSCFFPFPVFTSAARPWVYNIDLGRPLSVGFSPSLIISTTQHQAIRFATVFHLQPQTPFTMSSQPFVQVVEAPVTFKAYLMCAFASFGGIFFGYDSGYING